MQRFKDILSNLVLIALLVLAVACAPGDDATQSPEVTPDFEPTAQTNAKATPAAALVATQVPRPTLIPTDPDNPWQRETNRAGMAPRVTEA